MPDKLVDQIRRGDRRSLARAMTLVDGVDREATALKDLLRQSTGDIPWWGFTGPPGVGKSTLIDTLIALLRRRSRRIGVVAIDPSSIVSNGALLGDRVRMMRHAVDRDVFIRSLATRGREGGLSDAALHCARLLELAGYDPVLIETVGVGQNEVDVASVADVCVVVLGPGYGDEIQLIKAGLLEIADVVVVNKCDLPEAGRLLQEVHGTMAGRARTSRAEDTGDGAAPAGDCRVEVLGVEARSGKGVEPLLDVLMEAGVSAREPVRQSARCERRILAEIKRSAMRRYEESLGRALSDPAGGALVGRLLRGECSFDTVVENFTAQAAPASSKDLPGVERRPGEESV